MYILGPRLGTIFTSDGSAKSALIKHAADKVKHLHKYIIFITANKDYPFYVKRKVLEAAFNAAILYGAESWIGLNCSEVNDIYISAIKCLLGVRKTTSNDICLLEIGLPPLSALVKQRQYNFLHRTIVDRQDLPDDPFMYALYLTRTYNKPLADKIDTILSQPNQVQDAQLKLRERLYMSTRTKYVTYRTINYNCDVNPVYLNRDTLIPEYIRISWTRFRLSSHSLRIETGRWQRLPREQRLCPCGLVQDEQHVLCACVLTQNLRDSFGAVNFPDILAEYKFETFRFVHDILDFYQNSSRVLCPSVRRACTFHNQISCKHDVVCLGREGPALALAVLPVPKRRWLGSGTSGPVYREIPP